MFVSGFIYLFVYFGLVLTSDLDPGSGAVRADKFIGPLDENMIRSNLGNR